MDKNNRMPKCEFVTRVEEDVRECEADSIGVVCTIDRFPPARRNILCCEHHIVHAVAKSDYGAAGVVLWNGGLVSREGQRKLSRMARASEESVALFQEQKDSIDAGQSRDHEKDEWLKWAIRQAKEEGAEAIREIAAAWRKNLG